MSPVTLQDISPRQLADKKWSMRHFFVRYGFFIFVCIVFLIFAYLRPTFLSAVNIADMLRSVAIAGLMFLGLTWIIAYGEIDVSFMSIAALSNMIAAKVIAMGGDWGLAAAAGLAVGLLFGLLNGALVGLLRLPALVTTIASGSLAASIAASIGRGTSISINHKGVFDPLLDISLFGLFPIIFLIVATLFVIARFFQDHLTFGHYIYAAEQNIEAMREAGIPYRRLLFILFLTSGIFCACAGVLLSVNLSSGQPYLGTSYFLDGLTAVLLGGMALKYGKPNVIGTLAAIIFLVGLLNGAALLGWSDAQRQIVRGSLLLIGVGIVIWSRRRSKNDIVLS